MSKRLLSAKFIYQYRRRLEQCWSLECDIDPLILRARLLHRQNLEFQALAVEQELLPIV
ncbi:MAG: hypothetical protein AB8A40_07205 [Prochlorococcus sp.]|jgi:hypothetical protein|nr:hypothetical protein [Prochlorococcaceae cyanobacterium ETNP18_MAG_14]MDP6309583.1 hypothetical protein [Prochlorococcaceae cyanobacterium ETNP14_MAG_4]HJM80809.1 hypothetical protein [Prochlorococcaceae cyanobacterium Fu_MAG_72]|tara:strand:+ start:2155 stop:2331 length:177 start_codon:yes stop_codon:yes gene_type:complete